MDRLICHCGLASRWCLTCIWTACEMQILRLFGRMMSIHTMSQGDCCGPRGLASGWELIGVLNAML
jgi:hypothetical protein